MVSLQRNYAFPRLQRGSKIFQGVQHFPGVGGPNANFYRNPYNLCDFPTPLWIQICFCLQIYDLFPVVVELMPLLIFL